MRAYIELMRPKNLILAAVTVPLGASFATLGAAQWISAGVFALSVLTFMGAANAMNDIKDASIDKTAHPLRPIPSERVTVQQAKYFSIFLWIASIASLAYGCTLIESSDILAVVTVYLIAIIMMMTYDFGPATKEKGLIGNIVISLLVAAVLIFGAATHGGITSRLVWMIAGVVFSTNLAREIIKDCQDMEADEGVRETLPMRIGKEKARYISYTLLMAALVFLYIPFYKGPFHFNQILFQAPAILVIITTNKQMFDGNAILVASRIRIAMLLGLAGFILPMLM